jgi:hypothetical protein
VNLEKSCVCKHECAPSPKSQTGLQFFISMMSLDFTNDEIKNNRSAIAAFLKFFEDNGVEFIDEKDLVGVKVDKKVIKQKFK